MCYVETISFCSSILFCFCHRLNNAMPWQKYFYRPTIWSLIIRTKNNLTDWSDRAKMANKTKQVLDSVAYLINTESKYTTAHILSIKIATRFVPICSVDVFNVWTAAAIKLLVQSRAVFLFLITGKRFLIYSEIICSLFSGFTFCITQQDQALLAGPYHLIWRRSNTE